MNILVTGVTGFIGGAVIAKLSTKSAKVIGLTRDKADLRNYQSIKKAFKNIDIVINCAGALPYHKLPNKDYWDINTKGVQNVVKACIENNVKRLIHLSTVGIYSKNKDAYANSKLEGENIILESKMKKKSVILRPTICYGPGDTRPVFLRLFKMIKKRINISIGGGKNYFHTVYIDNLVDIIVQSVYKNKVLGKDFIVGDIDCPKMSDITKEIMLSFNKHCLNIVIPKWLALFFANFFGVSRTVHFISDDLKYSLSKLKSFYNLKSQINLREGVKKTFNWYNANNLI